MITLQIKFLGETKHKSRRWKVISNTDTPPHTVCADSYGYRQAAQRYIDKHYPDCTIIGFGGLPAGDMVALACSDELNVTAKKKRRTSAYTRPNVLMPVAYPWEKI